MRKLFAVAAVAALSPLSSFAADAACPAMSVYEVSGVNATRKPLSEAMELILTGTAWRADVTGNARSILVSFANVSGPLDKVVEKVASQAGSAAGASVVTTSDPTRCLVTVAVREDKPAAAKATATAATTTAATTYPLGKPVSRPVLRAGKNLSEALSAFVDRNGWSLRWNIEDDYVLDVDLPLPKEDVIESVTWLVRTYQAQGGLAGVVPRFAKGNRVVVIEKMDVREAQ